MTTQLVWKKYADDLKRFIFSYVKDTAVTDDILQDSFIKIHTKLHTLKNITKLKPWLFSITRNTILDYYKTSKKTLNISLDNFEIIDDEKEPHTEKDCLHGILSGLPKKYRDPLFLYDIKGMKQSEIAQQLKLKLPTVKSRIQRARKKIAQGFIDCCGFTYNAEGKLVGETQEKENCKICS